MPNLEKIQNILPKDGILSYHSTFMSSIKADEYFQKLCSEVIWRNDSIRMYGKEYPQPRLTAWYADPSITYTYSKITMQPTPWSHSLLAIKQEVETFTGRNYNSVLINYYRSEKDHMSWHSDDEPELGVNPWIASLSLGGVRCFQIKHRRDKLPKIDLNLASGSLLMMGGEMQENWVHKIAKTSRSCSPRINLTFRSIIKT